jgi:hypothetical protein
LSWRRGVKKVWTSSLALPKKQQRRGWTTEQREGNQATATAISFAGTSLLQIALMTFNLDGSGSAG